MRKHQPGYTGRSVSTALGLVLVLLVLASCSETVFEVSPDTVYVLSRVNGERLPATLVVSQFGIRTLEADTLRFVRQDRWERVRWVTEHETGSDEIRVFRETWAGVVLRAGSSYTLVDDGCADPRTLALCIAPDTAATLGDRSLVLRGPVPPAGVKRFEAH